MEPDRIVITGARQHNLKNVTVEIPKKKLVVLTGVSGSGKSSLAFDTLYAEGQRRYIESLSAYARQFLGQMDKPLYDSIRGLAPTISIEQKTASTNPRSTVGTVTEVHDYLRVLWARVGRLTCHRCGRPVSQQSAQQIVHEVLALPEGTKFLVLAPLVRERKGEHRDVIEQVRKSGFTRVRVDGIVLSLDDDVRLDKKKKHSIDAVVDRLVAKPGLGQRLTDSVETALKLGQGTVVVAPEGQPDQVLSEHRACHHCGISFPEPTPQLFSFNSPQGMCPECSGLGTRMEMDPALVVPNPELSVNEGAVKPLGAVGEATTWGSDIVRAVARERGIDLNRPWKTLPEEHRRVILFGTGSERVSIRVNSSWGSGAFKMRYEGAINSMMRRMRETKSEEMRQYYQKYLSSRPCSACDGRRIRPEALGVKIAGKAISEITGALRGRGPRLLRLARAEGRRGEDRGRAPEGDPLAPAFPPRRGPHLPHPRPRRPQPLRRRKPADPPGQPDRLRADRRRLRPRRALDRPPPARQQEAPRRPEAPARHRQHGGGRGARPRGDGGGGLADRLRAGGGAPRRRDRGRGHAGPGHEVEGEPHRAVPPGRAGHRDPRRATERRRPPDHRARGPREQPQGHRHLVPPGPLRLCHRRLRGGQEHARQPHPLPRDRPGAPRERRAGRGARSDRRPRRRSTRSSTSTRAPSGGPRARTRPPTRSSSTSSATSSPSCPRRGCTATPPAASPST